MPCGSDLDRGKNMGILYLLIPLTVVIMIIAIWGFIWAIKNGQFDDLEGPAYRILMDDDDPRIPRPGSANRKKNKTQK
jgi:cbb3-type cytochrome oxidase maturation protein